MIYKYGDDKTEEYDSVYSGFDYVNLGDYIQSIASLYFCGRKQVIYIDRDFIRYYNGPPVKMIMNAWWNLQNSTYFPSERIMPLYISYHIDNQHKKFNSSLWYLRKHEPIGCRDISTMNYLKSLGINAYFSGCLTLTLGLSYHNYANKINDAILCIVNCDNCIDGNVIWDFLNERVLKYYNFSEIMYLNKNFKHSTAHYDRFNEAYRLLKIYEKSTLVLTSNLHTILPCISMNTPVIYISGKHPDKRFSGYLKLINYAFVSHENGNYYLKFKININITCNKKKMVENFNDMNNFTDFIIKRVNDFMN